MWFPCGISDGDSLQIEGLSLEAIYTPGHTDDSYSFRMQDRVFTGDTLLIRGTGRTDFQNGDARQQYDSIFNRLLKLPDETLVYPAHDYKGDTVSTIAEERAHNPRLQVKSVDEYVAIMNGLNLSNPKMMDVAVPANKQQGLAQEQIARRGWAFSAELAADAAGSARHHFDRPAREARTRTPRRHTGRPACALPRPAGKYRPRRHAERTRQVGEQDPAVLLRVRGAVGDGGAGGQDAGIQWLATSRAASTPGRKPGGTGWPDAAVEPLSSITECRAHEINATHNCPCPRRAADLADARSAIRR